MSSSPTAMLCILLSVYFLFLLGSGALLGCSVWKYTSLQKCQTRCRNVLSENVTKCEIPNGFGQKDSWVAVSFTLADDQIQDVYFYAPGCDIRNNPQGLDKDQTNYKDWIAGIVIGSLMTSTWLSIIIKSFIVMCVD